MKYIRLRDTRDAAIPDLTSLYRLPEVSKFIHIDEEHYWDYVASSENVFYYKVYRDELLVAAIHCELSERVLYMDIVFFPVWQRKGIGGKILRDIQSGTVVEGFDRIVVSIDESNSASIRLFEKMSFLPGNKDGELIEYVFEMGKTEAFQRIGE